MPTTALAFGTSNVTSLTVDVDAVGDRSPVSLMFHRAFWFDRDLDGSWLVWVSTPDDAAKEHATGALVVRDPVVVAFLEELGHLLATPQHYAEEPEFAAVRPSDV